MELSRNLSTYPKHACLHMLAMSCGSVRAYCRNDRRSFAFRSAEVARAWFIYLDLRKARGWFISLQPCLLSCETFFVACFVCFVKNCEISMLGDWLRKLKVFASHSAGLQVCCWFSGSRERKASFESSDFPSKLIGCLSVIILKLRVLSPES